MGPISKLVAVKATMMGLTAGVALGVLLVAAAKAMEQREHRR